MSDLIDAQAINAIKTVAQRFPAQLSESGSLWRKKMPLLARLGVLTEVRAALEGTPGGNWEKDLALAEAAILERDWKKASVRFW